MSFNCDPTKQAQDVIFYLGLVLDSKLNFGEHLQNIYKKLPKQLQLYSNSKAFYLGFHYSLYMSLVPALILVMEILLLIHHITKLSTKKLQSIQYNACLAIIEAIRGTSVREKLYQETNICTFYKVFKNKSPSYLFTLIPQSNQLYSTKNFDKMLLMNIKHYFSESIYFHSAIIKWDKLDLIIRNSESYEICKRKI